VDAAKKSPHSDVDGCMRAWCPNKCWMLLKVSWDWNKFYKLNTTKIYTKNHIFQEKDNHETATNCKPL